jgi:hypothetical protein
MKLAPLLLAAMVGTSLAAEAAEFRKAQLTESGTKLTITQSDGTSFNAPRNEDQDSFAAPGVSRNHRYAGWLALYPNQGASYSQPLDLAVVDASMRIHRFSGNFGMVFGWCFAEKSDAVVYRFSFPHGMTPVHFEMRRIDDGKLLREFQLEPIASDEDESQVIWAKAPVWTRCAQRSR